MARRVRSEHPIFPSPFSFRRSGNVSDKISSRVVRVGSDESDETLGFFSPSWKGNRVWTNLELKWDTRCKNLTFFRVSSGEKLIQHGAVNFAKIPLSAKRYRENPRGFGCLLRTIFEGLKRCLWKVSSHVEYLYESCDSDAI